MPYMPIIELRVQELGEHMRAMVMLHHHEIEGYLQAGVEKALAGIGQQIIDEAAQLAAQQVRLEVKNYLTYGPGSQAIRAAIERALEPLTAMLRGEHPRQGSE